MRLNKDPHITHSEPVYFTTKRLVKISEHVAQRGSSDTTRQIFKSCNFKFFHKYFVTAVLCFFFINSCNSKKIWKRILTREKEYKGRGRRKWESKIELQEKHWSPGSNCRFPRMLDSNWEHEVLHKSPARVWVFGLFFPFFSLRHSRSSCCLFLSFRSFSTSLLLAIWVCSPFTCSFILSFPSRLILSFALVRAVIAAL